MVKRLDPLENPEIKKLIAKYKNATLADIRERLKNTPRKYQPTLEQKYLIAKLLQLADTNLTQISKELGLQRQTLYTYRKEFGSIVEAKPFIVPKKKKEVAVCDPVVVQEEYYNTVAREIYDTMKIDIAKVHAKIEVDACMALLKIIERLMASLDKVKAPSHFRALKDATDSMISIINTRLSSVDPRTKGFFTDVENMMFGDGNEN